MAEGLSNWYNNLTSGYGGAGNYGYVQDGSGGYVGVNQDAFNAVQDPSIKMTSTEYSKSGLGNSSGGLASLGSIGTAVQGLSGLANAYLGYKNYGLAKDQFGYEKALSNANLYNQGTLVNNQLDKSAQVGNALAGGTMTDAQRQSSLTDAASRHVKTTI